jgi:expansin
LQRLQIQPKLAAQHLLFADAKAAFMTVPPHILLSHPRRLHAATVRLHAARLALLAGASLVGGALVACGSATESDDSDLPTFGLGGSSGQAGAGGSATGPAGAAAAPACTPGSAGCGPVTPEGMNPNTPIDQASNTPIASTCTPNAVSCSGSVLTRCNATGDASTTQDCATTGGSCGQVAGVASCVAPSCTPSAVECDGANTIATCAADGSGSALSRCPDGTVCAGAGTCNPVTCNQQELINFNGGQATVYWFAQGTINQGDIACGYGIQPGNPGNGDGDAVTGITVPTLFAAMNTENYRDAAACGACVEMSYQGRNVTVTVVDECPIGSNPTCTAGHVDLSRGAWNMLTGNAAGTQISGVNWRYVPCETTEKVTVQLKEPTNAYWNEFLVRNHRYPIEKAEVQHEDGTWVEAPRTRYNYFHPPADDMGSYRVRLTDINGGVIEEQLELAAGQQGGDAQFACQ